MKKKLKNIYLKIKNSFLDNLEKTKILYINYKIVFYYIIGSVINGIILRLFTIGNFYSIPPLLADLFITIIFASFYFLIKEKNRFVYLMIMSILSTLICVANIIYYNYYSSFISITFISFIFTNHDTGDANVVGNLINIKYFIFVWLPIFLYFFNRKKKNIFNIKFTRKTIRRTFRYWTLIFLFIFICTLKLVDFSRFYTQWNREYLVSKFGIYLYQINDVLKSVETKTVTLFGSDKAYKDIFNYFENTSDVNTSSNKYTNIFEGKNVIAIHAESLQNVVIDLDINGESLTPNLNKLANEGLYFSNFYSQVSFGTSSDTEFTLATSLLPVNIGTVFNNYYTSDYVTMYNLLKDKGYYTFCMHANNGDFWNRNLMYKKLGYDKFYEKSSYNIDETIGFGLSDKSFMLQSVNYIEEIAKNNTKFYGTMITLSNHTPFSYNELFEKIDLTMNKNGVQYSYMDDTKLGDYFVSVHYADEQIGLLINELDKRGLLDNVVIVIYGDHDARISTSQWERFYNYDYNTDDILDENDPEYKELDYYWQELNRSVPFIVWTKDKSFQKNYSKEITTAMGMYDVLPTLGNMFGFYNKYALGNDIFELDDNIVVFPNGNFVTNYVYYNDLKGEYIFLKDEPLSDNYIDENKKNAEAKLDISNNIIVYNYFKKILSNKKYEVE